jgi:serine/threonine-protein kinase
VALNPGRRLGPYEITAPLGVGGMGEVYRATDTNLKRQVAIKVLPSSVVGDPERLARFQREAEVLAALNHPNIAHIHGLEKSDGAIALVMELVEGPTLADRIAKAAIPIDEAVPIAKQIADALEAAHEQAIVHRDLKPANIKVREDGTVKVLDFGLAKALEPTGTASASVSISPTITSPALTQAGIILGTAAYMAPEQARGKAIDKRADIWAFGCVLFEMLTGKRAFDGEDTTDTLAFVITREPDWSLLPSKTPASIRKILTKCLQKDRSRRLRDMGDVRLDLDEATGEADANRSTSPGLTQSPHTMKRRVFIGIGIAVVSMALGAAGTAVWRRPAPQTPSTPQRTTIVLPEHVAYSNVGGFGGIAISPDGTHIAYPAAENGKRLLYLRNVDQLEGRPIPGTDNAANPFFSYDGQWIAFFTYETTQPSNKLKKVAIRGGPSVPICDAPIPPGGSWGPDDIIVFATGRDSGSPISLLQVPAAGGTPKPLLVPDPVKNERRFGWPDVLPGGKAVLFSATTPPGVSFGDGHIAVLSLENGQVRTIIDHGFHARYVPTGHIVYMVDGQLMAVPFDLKRLEVTGAPAPLVEGVHVVTNVGEASFAVSPTGFLIYAPGPPVAAGERTLAWVDRQGHEQPIAAAPPHAYVYARLSPDGARIALDARDENDIWTFDIARGTPTRLTFGPAQDNNPFWTPDGRRIAFASDRDHAGTTNLYIAPADNSGQPVRLTSLDTSSQYPTGFSHDGKILVFMENDPKTGFDLHSVTVDNDHRVTPLLHTSAGETNGAVSPDGRWLAYQFTGSGPAQIYVRPFPNVDTGGLHQVSTNGGTRPVWARNGRELFYMSGNGPTAIMAVPVELGTNFVAGTPQRLFDGPYYIGVTGVTYDVSPDGKRFLMIKTAFSASASALSQFVFVNNWFDELKRLVPTK